MMVDPAAFRTGSCSVPFSSQDELPPCGFAFVYLLSEESTVCYCESFYYFCASSWPDKLTQTVPPCLQES